MRQQITDISPFYQDKVKCPICEKKTEITLIRPKSYIIEEYELDTHPLKIRWINPLHSHHNPAHFTLHNCENCYYTNTTRKFPEVSSDEYEENYFRETFHKLRDDFVLVTLGELVIKEKNSFQKSLYQHYIYLYIIENVPQKQEMQLLRAKFFLRIAWLFRENEIKFVPTKNKVFRNLYNEEFSHFHSAFADFFEKSVFFFSEHQKIVQKFQKDEDFLKFIPIYEKFSHNSQQLISELQTTFANFITEEEMSEENEKSPKNIHNGDIQNIIAQLKQNWKFLPTNEEEAIRESNHSFLESFLLHSSMSIKRKLKYMEIVAYSFYKIKQDKEILDYAPSAYKMLEQMRNDTKNKIEVGKKRIIKLERKMHNSHSGSETILEQNLNKNKFESFQKEKKRYEGIINQAKRDLVSINDQIDKFKKIRRKANERYMITEQARALKIISELESAFKEEDIIEMLRKQNIPEEVVDLYFGTIEHKTKKSIFGSWLKL